MSDELKAIQKRHNDWEEIGFVRMGPNGAILAHKDRATLLSLLTASQARAEAAEARVGELADIADDLLVVLDNLKFKMADQTINDKDKARLVYVSASKNVEYFGQLMASIHAALTLKGAPDGR